MQATYANADGTDVALTEDDGTVRAVKPDDPILEGLEIAPFAAPALVVLEVLPVPLRIALAETPSPIPGHPHAEAAINALVGTMPRPAQIAWEYLVVAKRADLLTMAGPAGLPEEWVDAVLAAAAAKADSGAVWGPRP